MKFSLSAERIYYVLGATQSLAFAIMFTTYTVYYVQAAGLDPLQLVLVGTVLEATYFLFEIPTGVVADVYSRRLSVILGVFFLGVGFLIVGLWPVFWMILLGQVISAIGYTFLSGATTAWLADEVGEANVGPILLRASQIDRVAGLIGIALSAALASIALSWPFISGALLLLALGFFLLHFMPEHGFKPKPTAERNTFQQMWHGFTAGVRIMQATPILLMLLGVEFFMGASSEGFDRLGDAHLLANFTFPSLGNWQPVVWFSLIGIAGSVLGFLVIEPLRKRLEALSRNPAQVAWGLLAFDFLAAACGLMFALSGQFALAVAALLVRGLGFALGEPLFQAWLVQNTKPEVRATLLSMVGQSNALGQMLGGPGLGWLGQAFGLRLALTVAALILLPALPFYARAANLSQTQSKEVEQPA
ncbi:MAG: MFS transporter [Anaerolineales bacterium]|nr:MFS transporter [Anaerolineales bacterium]